MKRLICVLLSCAILLSALPIAVFANDSLIITPGGSSGGSSGSGGDYVITPGGSSSGGGTLVPDTPTYPEDGPTSGTCGDDLTWNMAEDGTFTVSGKGAMDTYNLGALPWGSHLKKIESLVIEEGVTSISNSAFQGCINLTSVSLPDSLTHMDYCVFGGCSMLESITIPEGVTSIEPYLFDGCKNLKNVTIPDSVTSIGFWAFSNCTSLESIALPAGLTSIGNAAFYHCSSLKSIALPNLLITLELDTFGECENLERITIPPSVTSIDDSAFYGCPNSMIIRCVRESYADEFATQVGFSVEYYTLVKLHVALNNEAGTPLTEGYTVRWFKEGSHLVLAEGTTLHSAEPGKTYEYQILLDESLGMDYAEPARQTITVAEDREEDLTLSHDLLPIPDITVTGTLTDSNGKPLSGVTVVSTQLLNGKYTRTEETKTDENGVYSLTVAKVDKGTLSFSLFGYYDKSVTLSRLSESTEATHDLGSTTLLAMPADKITLTLQKIASAEVLGMGTTQSLTSFYGLQFSLYNVTQDRAITDFTAQYPYLVINDAAVQGGDLIRISVIDTNGSMTADPIEITLSALKVGDGSITFLENGKIKGSNITSAGKSIAMLFDESGSFVCSLSVDGGFLSPALPAGSYQLVLMEQTSLLRSLSHLGKLADMGLVENTDYVLQTVEVTNGYITPVGECTIPDLDETKLYYTLAESTSFTVSTGTATLGKYLVMRLEYAIDSKYQSANQYVTLELPEGVVLAEGSLSLDGVITPYSKNGNEIKVMTNRSAGVIRFYVYADAAGSYNLNAYLGFDNDQNAVLQPLGTASFTAELDRIDLPSKTGYKTVVVSGTTLPGSTVTVYDNGTAVGTATSNRNGSWSLRFELDSVSLSFHEIYATIANVRFEEEVQTEIKTLVYDENYINLSKITMISYGPEVIFDFLDPKPASSYSYAPGNNSFTFVVEFTGGDDSVIHDVYVVTTNAAGEETYIPVTYDPTTGAWLGTYVFDTFEKAPVAINAVWDNDTTVKVSTQRIDVLMQKLEEIEEQEILDAEAAEMINQMLKESGMTLEEFENVPYDSAAIFGDLFTTPEYAISCDSDGIYASDGQNYFKVTITTCDGLTEQLLLDNGFTASPTDEGYNIYTKTTDTCSYYADLKRDEYYIVEMSILQVMSTLADTMKQRSGNDTMQKLLNALNTATDAINNFESFVLSILVDLGDLELDKLQETKDAWRLWNKAPSKLSKDIAFNSARASYKALKNVKILQKVFKGANILGVIFSFMEVIERGKELADLGQEIYNQVPECSEQSSLLNELKVDLGFLVAELTLYYVVDIGSSIALVTGAVGGAALTGGATIAFAYGVMLAKEAVCYAYSKKIDKQIDNMRKRLESLDDLCEDPDEPDPDDPDNQGDQGGNGGGQGKTADNADQKITPILDPSGYVYEAVPSNRVEGVKVEAYYYDYPLDEFGMPKDTKEEILWDASEYDQVNPLYTDKDGRYAWDVPVGQWLVKYSKEGYYDTDSRNDPAAVGGYLPVPPPQVDVNVGIISKASPTVASINAYSNEIQIIFSQYLQLDSVNATNVVFKQNGISIPGTLSPANAEYNYEGTVQYASIFTFVPDSRITGVVDVEIQNVINYAGSTMAALYSAQKTVVAKPESITLPETVDITYGESFTLSAEILPAEAGKSLTLTVTSSSPNIVEVVSASVTTDENGVASIVLKGLLPGQSKITVAIDGTTISAVRTVNVAMKKQAAGKCEKVVSNIASGSEVEAGTQIILSTPTDGAEIYYTLDKTCPCITDSPSRIKYTGPLTITENVYIIAYAVKEGYEESATSQFVYTVKTTAVCDHAESTSKPTCDASATCSLCSGEIPALGHDYASVLTAEEATHYYACSRCQARKDESAHSFVWITDKEATENENGSRHEECVCGATRSENTPISGKSADSESPDDNSAVVWIIVGSSIALLGAAAAVTLVILKKKRTK